MVALIILPISTAVRSQTKMIPKTARESQQPRTWDWPTPKDLDANQNSIPAWSPYRLPEPRMELICRNLPAPRWFTFSFGQLQLLPTEADMKNDCRFAIIAAVAFILKGTAAEASQCNFEISNLQKLLTSSDAGMGPTGNPVAQPSTAGVATMPETTTPPTAGANKALEGKAASPEDVQRQNEGQPTAGDTPSTGQMPPANTRLAQESLARAQELNKAGKEAECQNEVNKAKAAFGAH
jgi:hypothetical protein